MSVGSFIEDMNGKIKDARNVLRYFKSLFDEPEERKLEKGDIIGICRGVYDHYGVYASKTSVIHYSSPDADISFNNCIVETTLAEFMRDDAPLFKLNFPASHRRPGKIMNASALAGAESEILKQLGLDENYRLYGPEETIARARSRLGERAYNLCFNNCEHFAIWCKTGISESYQIKALIEGRIELFNF